MPASRSPRKPSAHRLAALERRVARLERQAAQPAPVPSYPLPTIYPIPSYGWQRCPLCGALYTGVHACWTYNPSYQPWITTSTTTTDLPAYSNTCSSQQWGENVSCNVAGCHLH